MTASPLTEELLRWFVCPACRQPLALQTAALLRCNACTRTYPIVDGLPVLLPPSEKTM